MIRATRNASATAPATATQSLSVSFGNSMSRKPDSSAAGALSRASKPDIGSATSFRLPCDVRFVLASASPARLNVLRQAGIDPVVRVSGVDEDAVTTALPDASHQELVTALAEAKAEAVVDLVAAEHPDAVIVGCDSMLSLGDEILGKPGTPERARQRWAAMGGNTGDLLTGHAVIRLRDGRRNQSASHWESTQVRFSKPTEAELDAYVASGEPLSVAGAFTIDGRGGWFVDGIDGNASSVIGISLPLTRRLLAEVGVSVTELWETSS
jgi:septum formation protein